MEKRRVRVRGVVEGRPSKTQAAASCADAALHLATSTNDQGGKKAGWVLTKWKSTFYHVFSGIKRKYLHMSSRPELLS